MACATGCASTATGFAACTRRRARAASAPEVTRRILLGTYVLSAGYYDAYYRKAQQVRALIAQRFRRRVFASGVARALHADDADARIRASAPVADPYEMYLSDIFTATANLAGVPAMSLPIGRVDGLPVGGQFLAPHFGEQRMFAARVRARARARRGGPPMSAPIRAALAEVRRWSSGSRCTCS